MAYNIALGCRFVIGKIDNPCRSRLCHCSDNNPANIVNMNAVKHLSFTFNNACCAIAQRIERAASGAVNTGCAENFGAKCLLPPCFGDHPSLAAFGGWCNRRIFVTDSFRHIRIDRSC